MTCAASATETTASSPDAAERIFGRTIADARALLRRAKDVMIHYATDELHRTEVITLSKRAFAASIAPEADGKEMPCELKKIACSTWTLTIGGYGAIVAASRPIATTDPGSEVGGS
jgi:hypothetical protein